MTNPTISQLQEVLTASSPKGDLELVDDGAVDHPRSHAVAFGLNEKEIEIARDQAYAQLLQSEDATLDASVILSRQYAQRLAAAEMKIRLDSEFARGLQAILDEDGSANHDGYDADRVLGKDVIDDIFASNPNDKGKGVVKAGDDKGKEKIKEFKDLGDEVIIDRGLYPECGICGDVFQQTPSPLAASLSPNSSSKLSFGLLLPCPSTHAYCIGCLSQYIISKLDPESNGKVPAGTIVFPIRCPECSLDEWSEGLQDEMAEKVLTKDNMVTWYHQKLLDSQPHSYCPNPKCSAIIYKEIKNTPVICPCCQIMMCTYCKTLWHENLSCSQYQSLPLNERLPEDRILISLAKEKKWRRCPNCHGVIDRISGCNHMQCLCRANFCFQCGGKWGINKCLRGCDLWEDDEQLLDEDQQQGEAAPQLVNPPAIEVPNLAAGPPQLVNPPAIEVPNLAAGPQQLVNPPAIEIPNLATGHQQLVNPPAIEVPNVLVEQLVDEDQQQEQGPPLLADLPAIALPNGFGAVPPPYEPPRHIRKIRDLLRRLILLKIGRNSIM